MRMVNPSHLLILFMWFSLGRTLSEEAICPPLTNVKINIYPETVNITWDCNITESMKQCHYAIQFQEKIGKELIISACSANYSIVHLGITVHKLYATLFVNKNAWKILTATPEGKENTAAENFSCKVYDVSIVNCSWAVGREAPRDTQYHLTFRHRKDYVPCENYRRDTFGRQVGCVWKSPNFNFSWKYYIQLVGSSNETSIRFYDAMLKPNDYVILDPPRNIRLNYSSTGLKITWEMPETYKNAYKNHCFLYDININGEIISNLEKNSYIKNKLLPNETVNVSMRVKWEWFCSENTEPSRWSEPLIHDPNSDSTGLTHQNILIVLAVVTAVALFILLFLCHRCRAWKRLFPKVPQPTLKFFDVAEQKEFLEQDKSKMEVLSVTDDDDEECICSPIMEISQPETMT